MAKFVVILLTPIAIEMIVEHFSGRNAFAVFGGVPEACEVRGGRIRAQGPFLHSILAGTVGAVCWPLAFSLWRENRRLSLIGLAAALAIVLTSSSSGPIMTSLFGIMGLCWWRFRRHTRLLRWGALAALFGLNMVMNAPVYYLIAKIDLTGNSTGWHRSALIGASIKHFDEWWLGGTDYTRHWMPTGVQWSQNHTDITNHYIKMGVIGGLPLMLLFICVLQCAFSAVGRVVDANEAASAEERFRVWTLGAVLFAHAATFFSVSYFDQSVVFLYLVLAAIGSLSLAQPAEQHPGTESDVVVAVENETPFCHNC